MLPLLQVVAAFAVLGMRSAQLQAVSDMPNIVFVMADDYGWGDVGYNNGTALTPNLDMMAAGQHSLRLQRYYSGGTSMQACMQLLAKQCIGSLV
jgi:hypothetical protein